MGPGAFSIKAFKEYANPDGPSNQPKPADFFSIYGRRVGRGPRLVLERLGFYSIDHVGPSILPMSKWYRVKSEQVNSRKEKCKKRRPGI